MKKHIKYITALLMLVGMTGCGSERADVQEIPQLVEPVGVEMDTEFVTREDIYQIFMTSGTVVPYVEKLHFVVDGRLDEIKVVSGETVETGQVLATLENEELLEEIAALEAEMEDIRINGEFSDRLAEITIKMEQEELSELQLKGAYTESEAKKVNIKLLQTKLSQTQELRALELENKEKELSELQEEKANLEITAPFSGQVVYTLYAEQGEFIEGYVPVVCLAETEQLTISSEFISEQKINSTDRMEARIMNRTYGITHVPMESGEYAAKMLAGEEIRTTFLVDEGTDNLESGQYVAIILYDSCVENTLTVPANAIYREGKTKYVFKIVNGEKIRCEVTVGVITDAKAEILEGLQEGDEVYVKE